MQQKSNQIYASMPPVRLFFHAAVPGVAIILMCGFPRAIASIFVDSKDTQLLDMASRALWLFSLKFFFWWFSFTALGFYNAIQKPKNAAILTLSTALVFPLIMVAVLWSLGLDGLWLNQAATYIPVGIIAFVMLRKTQKELAPSIKNTP